MLMRKLKTIFVTALFATIAFPFSAAHADTASIVASDVIAQCIKENRNLDIMFLVDESKSLREIDKKPGNDPEGKRVEALLSVVEVLASTVDAGKDSDPGMEPIKIQLAIGGFGAKYTTRKAFAPFSGESKTEVIKIIKKQRQFDDDLYTRYDLGLAGALKEFKDQVHGDSTVCRILLWFSDGVHDDDNRSGFNSAEEKQISKVLCGEGGIADQLRTEDVFVVAAGLNSEPRELGLMRQIAAGGEPFNPPVKPGRNSITINTCGQIPPTGEFELTPDANEIINKIFDALADAGVGIPDDDVTLPACSDGTIDCLETRFTVDASISSFSMLATRPSNKVDVVLKMPNGQSVLALTGAGDVSTQKNIATFTRASDTKVLITVRRDPQTSIDGPWVVQFKGVGSAKSAMSVNFQGQASIELAGEPGAESQLEINRYEAEPINLTIMAKSSSTPIRDAQITLSGSGGVVEIVEDRPELGRFVVSKQALEGVLKEGLLSKASSATLKVQPLGEMPGLTLANGDPVKVDFNSQTFEILISNGANLPSFKGVKPGDFSFQGTPTKEFTLLFDGPDGSDGSVDFGKIDAKSGGKADFEVVGSTPCKIAKKQINVECTIKIVPNIKTYGKYGLQLELTYRSLAEDDKKTESVDGEITIPVTTTLPTDAGKGIVAALKLIAIFLVIQGLVRWLLAYLLSRYAPLSATARRVRIDATIDPTGGLTINPMHVNLSHSDEGFASENDDATASFNIFGYFFDCPVLRTFLKSTSSPVGIVSRDSSVVVGSRGVQDPKKNSQATKGLVELSLRRQWVVGVKTIDVQTLVNGVINAPAEVIAFLEPYEMLDRSQQIAELSDSIASSNFASDFSRVVAHFRDLVAIDESDTGVGVQEDSWGENTSGSGGAQISQPDVFGDTVSAVAIEDGSKASRKKKEKKSKKKESERQSSFDAGSASKADDWNPFA